MGVYKELTQRSQEFHTKPSHGVNNLPDFDNHPFSYIPVESMIAEIKKLRKEVENLREELKFYKTKI